MRFYFSLLVFFVPLTGLAQQAQVRQLQFVLTDLTNNFKESIDTLIIGRPDSAYSSRTILDGSMDNEIHIASDGKNWATYSAYISDSCSLKDAKELAEYWRDIAKIAAPNYIEKKSDGKNKTTSGHPFLGYDFESYSGNFKYWISISYSKRPTNRGYSVILILGKQIDNK